MLDAAGIRERIKVARGLRGMSQTELAQLLHQEDGWGLHDLGKLERGDQAFPPSSGRLRAIAYHLQVPAEFLTDPDPVPNSTRQLDRIELELGRAQEDRTGMRALIEQQNELLQRQSSILDRIEGLVAGLPTDETSRRLEQALRGEAPPPPPARTGNGGTGRAKRAPKRAAGQ